MLISTYDVPYRRIRMGSSIFVDVTIRDVEAAMEISCDDLVLPINLNWVAKDAI